MSRQPLRWYARRLTRMSPPELAWRTRDHIRRTTWATRQVRPGQDWPAVPVCPEPRFAAALPAGAAASVPPEARKAVVESADAVMAGSFDLLGVRRTDLAAPEWFLDPVTGRRSDASRYAFRVNYRSEDDTGNVKQVWELSRHHHLTVLAAAWALTGNDVYAQRVADQLASWWRANPFLSGVHWTSGIELGVRLVSWAWIRRLLDGWPPVADLFERNELALAQLHWHQRYLAAFRSRGSSANNHVIAEAAGSLVAACAFPWFAESGRWRSRAAALLERELERNTFPDGLNRELASDYHRFVAELGLLAATEAEAAGAPLADRTWTRLAGMLDAAAAVVDETLRPPRQGDGDEGRALVLGDTDRASGWSSFLALGAALVGPADWWPGTSPTTAATLVASLLPSGLPRRWPSGPRPKRRPAHFPGAGLTLLRTDQREAPEIWCRCDGGPHGFLSIAAHAHADALSIELRVGGVDVLADPGTYCYHGDERWRAYFRSTLAHNTVELGGRNQSVDGGPFLWLSHAVTRVAGVRVDDRADSVSWYAEHEGYASLDPPAHHRRRVTLDRPRRVLHVVDELAGVAGRQVRMAYHLGPKVRAELRGNHARLTWPTAEGTGRAEVDLPGELGWTAHRGETEPPLGWYSPHFGQRVPATVLLGAGAPDEVLLYSRFRLAP